MKALEPIEIVYLEKEVSITNDQHHQMMEFIDKRRNDTSFYGWARAGGSKEKMIDDITVGVLSEFLTYNSFIEMGFNFVAPPDLTYNTVKEKVWKPDLVVAEDNYVLRNLHVKGSRGYKDFKTWTFQLPNGDKGGDPLLSLTETDQNNYVSLVHVIGYNTGLIMAYGQWHTLKKHLKDPLLKDKIGIKTCLYYPFETDMLDKTIDKAKTL
jgi:hypothetical protein